MSWKTIPAKYDDVKECPIGKAVHRLGNLTHGIFLTTQNRLFSSVKYA